VNSRTSSGQVIGVVISFEIQMGIIKQFWRVRPQFLGMISS